MQGHRPSQVFQTSETDFIYAVPSAGNSLPPESAWKAPPSFKTHFKHLLFREASIPATPPSTPVPPQLVGHF